MFSATLQAYQKMRCDMTLLKALAMVEAEYKRAKTMKHIHNPLAYALYQVWKVADEKGGVE